MAASAIWQFQFSPSIGAPPTGNQLRFDAVAPYHDVSRIWVRFITNDGMDVFQSLTTIPVGVILYVQDKDDHEKFVELRTTGPAVDAGGYCEIPVEWVATGVPLTGQAVAFVITDATIVPPIPGPPGHAILVTLPQAKAHLRITAATDDEDIQFKLDQAEAIIRHYLKGQDDPAWTAATVPPPIKSAILLMLARLYEQRGDNEQNDEALWVSIDRMLATYRDPAVA